MQEGEKGKVKDMVMHYHDIQHEKSIPVWDENKQNGLKGTLCGYQRKNATIDKNKVTCKYCKKYIEMIRR